MAQIPAAFFLCWAPHMYAAGVLAGKVYDNANPRDFRDSVTKSEALEKAVSLVEPSTSSTRCLDAAPEDTA